jgi:hypothetical protein
MAAIRTLKLMCDRLSKSKENLISPDEPPAQVEVPEGPVAYLIKLYEYDLTSPELS